MREVSSIADSVAFYWSCQHDLPEQWWLALAPLLKQPALSKVTIDVFDPSRVRLYEPYSGDHLDLIFRSKRPSGSVTYAAGETLIVAALRVAQLLGFDLSSEGMQPITPGKVAEFYRLLDLRTAFDEIEDLAFDLGLASREFSVRDIATVNPQPSLFL